MKKYYFLVMALAALMSCSSDDFVGDSGSPNGVNGNGGESAISFNLNVPTVTRADKTGGDAATDLSNQFIVYAEKGETSDGAAPAAGKLVFQNYKVAYTANTAYTTTSNTKNWEYVGLSWIPTEQGNITTSTTDVQTIKYWDWGASSYTFTAVSALPSDINSGNVKITKTTAATDGNKVYDKGYSVVLNASADLDKLFFSERKVISSSNNTDRNATNAYGGNVTLRFHNAASKVRVAMYENIPGYSVIINKFSVDNDGDNPAFSAMTDEVTANFAANFQNCAKGKAGTLTVKYCTTGTVENHPTVSFSGTADKVLALGDQLKATVTIGESATDATYDKASKAYTSVFPKEDNAQNLKLKVSYTLKAPITNETIVVTDATAEIPAKYLQWKPGYAYTYLFKISDNTNGQTGTGTTPAGLYPITFDAIEMIAEDGKAEYITTVSEPTITTFGAIYNGTKYTNYVTGGNEYTATGIASGSQLDIFATFMEGSTVKTPTVGGSGAQYVNVFKVTAADPSLITEASVAEAIANPAMSVDIYTKSGDIYTKVTDATTITAGTTYYKTDGSSNAPGEDGYSETAAVAGTDYKVGAKINVTDVTTDASTNFSAAPEKVTSVPAEDGTTKTIDAVKLTGVKAGTYAIEYEASAAWTGSYKKVYKVIVVQ
ncbi:MAG: hypothetical protein IKH35_04340 [Prevotella sp.]|nr:hypothetical protein [Prevotella sp.]